MIGGLCWNARGISNRGTISYLNSILSKHQISLCAILEPKIKGDKISVIARKIGFPNFLQVNPTNKHIWIFWKDNLLVTMKNVSPQHITCEVTAPEVDILSYCTFVYASTDTLNRASLWNELSSEERSFNVPWIIMGDFNAIISQNEKQGGRQFGSRSSSDFNDFIIGNGLTDVGFSGSKFTWCNQQSGLRRIWMRLDRVLINGAALASFSDMKVTHMRRIKSDHSPLLIAFANKEKRQSFFKFNPAWVSHPNLKTVIEKAWNGRIHEEPMSNRVLKLKKLRGIIRKWNWDIYGDVNRRVADMSSRVEELENIILHHPSDEAEKELAIAHDHLNSVMEDRQVFLDAKAHIGWLKEGDRNSGLFHAAIKVRRNSNNFRILSASASVTDDREEIGTRAVEYFENLLGQFSSLSSQDYFTNIDGMISENESSSMSSIPSEEEVRMAVANLPRNSAPGPDGFTGLFYYT